MSRKGSIFERRGPRQPRITEPLIVAQEVDLQERKKANESDIGKRKKQMTANVSRRVAQECERCGCLRLPNGGQAVVRTTEAHGVVYFRCRNCGARFKLPLAQAAAVKGNNNA
jgi:RNase P subunit RPR2